MKLIMFQVTAALTLIANPASAAAPFFHARAQTNCPQESSNVLLFLRADKVGGDHLYSTNPKQISDFVENSGFKANGSVGYIYPTQEPHTVPLYRVYHVAQTDHFYTTDIQERTKFLSQGFSNDGIAGYVFPDGACTYAKYSVVPLYRLYSSKDTAHMLTRDDHEKGKAIKNGYVDQGPVGYVLHASF